MDTKYIHLAGDGTNQYSEYECVFNEDILVKKGSQIGLQALSLNFNPEQLNVDNTNNFFFVASGGDDGFGQARPNAQGGAAFSLRGEIPTGLYTLSTLTKQLQYELNRTNAYVKTNPNTTINKARSEFMVTVDNTTNKVAIQFVAVADDFSYTADPTLFKSGGGIDLSDGPNVPGPGNNPGAQFAKVPGNDNAYNYAVYTPIFIRSRGRFEVTLATNSVNTIVGLISELPDTTSVTQLDESGYFLALKTIAGNYQITYNGANTPCDPAVVPADGDVIRIEIGGGKYRISIIARTAAIANPIVLMEQVYDQTNYQSIAHACVSLYKQAAVVNQFMFTPSPFQQTTTDGIHLVTNALDLHGPNYITNLGRNPNQGTNPMFTVTLSAGLALVLGFTDPLNPSSETKRSQMTVNNWVGLNPIKLYSFPNSIFVELTNVQLNSYDSGSRRRKNILAYICGLENTLATNNYYFNANEIIYISTKLYDDTLINSWRVRVTDQDGDLIVIEPGKIAISLVIKN